jgi:hypothetical protein
MAIDDEEQRKAVSGIVTPDASQGEDWRRQVAGVYSFGDDDPTPGTQRGPAFSPVLPASFSPTNVPLALNGG